jgi:two-component system, sensor histidine kinase and response regulator
VTDTAGRLLIVDDESALMRALCDTLSVEGYLTRGFGSAQEASLTLRPGQFDLLLTDLMMPEMDGITLIKAVREIDETLGAIVMTGHGTIDTAVQAMQRGALDYVLKPFKLNVILPVISRALDVQRLRRENAELQERARRRSEELATAYQDLESFSYSISHDLRGTAPYHRWLRTDPEG